MLMNKYEFFLRIESFYKIMEKTVDNVVDMTAPNFMAGMIKGITDNAMRRIILDYYEKYIRDNNFNGDCRLAYLSYMRKIISTLSEASRYVF